jgi:hypothetical protein
VGWCDSDYSPDYGNSTDNYRSTSGWVFTYGGTAVSWRSRRQSLVAQSSTEAEYYAAADAAKEAVHLRRLFSDLGVHCGSVRLMEDNQSCLKQASNACNQEASRHVDVRAHFLREQQRLGNINMVWTPTASQLADQLTKLLPSPAHDAATSRFGVIPPSPNSLMASPTSPVADCTVELTISTKHRSPDDDTPTKNRLVVKGGVMGPRDFCTS